MVTTLRAALAVVLLAGFVVFGGAVIVGLVVAGVLLTLRVDELRAVLAHELGHYSHSHTRLGALTYRGRVTIVETWRRLGDGLVATLMQGYATMYLLVESAVSRRQEIEADAAAARYGGREAAVSALSRLATIDHAWQSYLDQYVAWGLDSGNAPTGITAGFATLLRSTDTHLAADGALERKHSPGDSDPPTAAPIAAIRALPDSSAAPDP